MTRINRPPTLMRGCTKRASDGPRSSRTWHVLMENRSGLVVATRVTAADGYGERDAALLMVAALPGGRVTLGGDNGYDCREFVDQLRQLNDDAARCATHDESAQRHRRADDAAPRLRDQPTDAEQSP